MKFSKNERVLVLGGSRGLGKALIEILESQNIFAKSLSRKSEIQADFAKPETWDEILKKIIELQPTRIIYCAAGGPYGDFQKFSWKDHAWALKVSFEFPAFLLHSLLKNPPPQLLQICLVGSAIAEDQADPGAAAYCAAKHALKGLVSSLQKETSSQFLDLRLLSPGYMQTDLLPLGSEPRNSGKAKDPKAIAGQMIHSISDSARRHSCQSFD